MAHPPGAYTPPQRPASPGGGSIEIDPEALARLKESLADAAGALERDRFGDVALVETAFGGSPTAQTLGNEHRLAHQIISDTIQGVITDLWGYRDGVALFEKGMGTADETSAADLRAEEVAVDSLAYHASRDDGGQRYRNSQAENLPAAAHGGDA